VERIPWESMGGGVGGVRRVAVVERDGQQNQKEAPRIG